MKASKLPSGNYRARAYDYTDSNGKKHYMSFTAPTKKEAEWKAMEYRMSGRKANGKDMTVAQAVEGYIKAKDGVFSPSTIANYTKYKKAHFDDIGKVKIKKLTNESVQLFVSKLSETLTYGTVKNIYCLLRSSVRFYFPDTSFRVSMPTKQKKKVKAPSDRDVLALMSLADSEMKICIMFAAFCSLRRAEICALRYGDIDGDKAHVHSTMVQDYSGVWRRKNTPKTSDSDRVVTMPKALIKLIGAKKDPEEPIINLTPSAVTLRFLSLRKKANLDLKFHSLRHYFASMGAVLNIPSVYLASFGGWEKSGITMKSVYQNEIEDMGDKYAKEMTDYFDELTEKKQDMT